MADSRIRRLAQAFRVRVSSSRWIKSGVCRIDSADGRSFALKRMRYPVSRLRWMDRTLRMTRQRGFPAIAWRHPRKREGRLLYAKLRGEGAAYILTPWIDGRQPSPRSARDLRACAAALARFHQAGRQAAFSGSGAYSLLGKWPSMLRSHKALIAKHIRRAGRGDHGSPLDEWLRSYGNDLLTRAEEALGILGRSSYRTLCRRSSGSRVLCHGDSGPKNFVLTPSGPFLIDFETLRLDLRAYDLYRLIRLACKSGGWTIETAKAVLDGYQSVSKLHRAEIDLMKVWLLFPIKAYKILSRYDRSSERGKRSLEKDLSVAEVSERQLIPFLRAWDDYLMKG